MEQVIFTGDTLFYFSMVRQFPNDDEEYFPIHADIRYQLDHHAYQREKRIYGIN